VKTTGMFKPLLFSTALLLAGCATAPGTAPAGVALPTALASFPESGTALDRTQTALDRIERIEPLVNAVIAIEPSALDEARALDRSAARGPLYGMPIMVKDNIETRGGLPTTAGSLALKDNVTGRDAPLVARLRQAGAVIVAKTNLSEWANFRDGDSISGWSAVGGQTRNPHALNRNACGSSSGSAVVVAAAWFRPRSEPRPMDRSPAPPRSTASSASSRPSVSSAAPMWFRSATARIRPAR
jgi:hypothetical protein